MRCDPELSFARASSLALGVTRAWNLQRFMPATADRWSRSIVSPAARGKWIGYLAQLAVGTTTVPRAVTTTIGAARTEAAESPRDGSARQTTRASKAICLLRRP